MKASSTFLLGAVLGARRPRHAGGGRRPPRRGLDAVKRLGAAMAVLLLAGCPERATPQRGVALTFQKPEGAFDLRPVVDRRLAQVAVKAALQEDQRTLTVRVPEGGDVAGVKQLLRRRARLAFCALAEAEAARWCERPASADIVVERDPAGCHLAAPTAGALSAALGDAGVPFLLGREAAQATAWAVEQPCLEPTLVAAAVQPAMGTGAEVALQVQLDRASAKDFAELTKRLVGRKLLVALDDELLLAPVVQEPITGGKVMVLVPEGEAGARELAAALAGGPLPALELISEKPYGPPSLR
jgi:preprotein translocase subunit SecD